jgi:hypothetical protein
MKLWKTIIPETTKKDIKRLSMIPSDFKRSNPINISDNSESIIKLVNKSKNISFYSSSDEERNHIKIDTLKSKTMTDNLFRNKNREFQKILMSTSPEQLHLKQKKNYLNNNIKTTYPKINNKKGKGLKSFSSYGYNKYRRNQFRIKNQKAFTPLLSHNTILNKCREDFHKLFFKSIKKTKAEFTSTFQRYNRIKNKLKIFQKKLIINNNKPSKDINFNINFTSEANNNELTNTNEVSSERKRNGKGLQIDTSSIISSPLKSNNNYYSKSPKKKFIMSTDQLSTISSQSSKTVKPFDYSQINTKLYKNYKRKRNFLNYMKESNILNMTWKKKIGLLDTELKYNTNLLTDLQFQSNTIKDEMNLLIDGIHHYKMRLYGNSDLIIAFMNKDISYQMNLNKTLEETCALLHLIPKIILKEYYMYSDRFISISEPGRENFISKIITNESECLNENIRLLYKIVNFVKSSFEVYIQLVNQVEEEMIIQLHDFEILRAIFQKSRYFIGNLINFANNMIKDFNFDKNLINKCRPILEHTKERLKEDWRYTDSLSKKKIHRRNDYYLDSRIRRSSCSEDIYAKMQSNINFGNRELNQKILRITKALETGDLKNMKNNYADELKLKQVGCGNKNGPMALIYSPLMTKMLKYIRKDIREKIISLRSSEKYIDIKEE